MAISIVKVKKAQKKGILNVFGAYDNTNDKMYMDYYQKKTGKQFIDFLKRVEKGYHENIQNISFLYLIIFQYINQGK
ncbi:MAG TPA: hypothetical protein VN704_02705 [Verrucomicrobiae bacterium]|nr:hypothetical protein [Verrucomicrobiae bacterium]